VLNIDPETAAESYRQRVLAQMQESATADELATVREQLSGACTTEIASFDEFAALLADSADTYDHVIFDTAPTGHTLLLMDATGAYHRQMMHSVSANSPVRMVTPLMRLQDPAYTRIILVTLPETTPVSQAAALQADLRRAQIEPYAWVMNRSVLAAGTRDSLLAARVQNERKQMARIAAGLVVRTFVVPWLLVPPLGVSELTRMVRHSSASP
jgi:arsenite-transporting ATPase